MVPINMQTSSVTRFAALFSCCLAWACATRTAPTDANSAPAVFAERDNTELELECPSLVGDPHRLFADRIELRLPIGVALDQQMTARASIATCAGGRSIDSVTVIERSDDDPSLPISVVRDQLLDSLDLPNEDLITTLERDDAARRMTSVIYLALDPERATLMMVGLRGGAGRIYVVMFVSSADQFMGLLPSFTASLESLRIRE